MTQERSALDGLLRSEIAIAAHILADLLLLSPCATQQHFASAHNTSIHQKCTINWQVAGVCCTILSLY